MKKVQNLKANHLFIVLFGFLIGTTLLFLTLPGIMSQANADNWQNAETTESVNLSKTFNANGGSWGAETTKTLEETPGSNWVFPEDPAWEGYSFQGWYVTTEYLRQITEDDIVPNNSALIPTLYAKWVPTFSAKIVSSDGSKFKYVNTEDPTETGITSEYLYSKTQCVLTTVSYIYDSPDFPKVRWQAVFFDEKYNQHRFLIEGDGAHPITNAVGGGNTITVTISSTAQDPVLCTFDANGGSFNDNNLSTKDFPEYEHFLFKSPSETPVYTNHELVGWFTEPEDGEEITFLDYVPTGGLPTLYAHWVETDPPAPGPEPEPKPGIPEEISANTAQTSDIMNYLATGLMIIALVSTGIVLTNRRIKSYK